MAKQNSPETKLNLGVRAICFFVVALLFFWRSHNILDLFGVFNYDWYVPLLMSILSALFCAFWPVSCLRSLSLVFILPLAAICAVELVAYWTIVVAVCMFVIAIFIAVFAGGGYLLVNSGYGMYGITGASVATIILITILLLTFRGASRLLHTVIKTIRESAQNFASVISDQWFPFPQKLIMAIWDFAKRLGNSIGGNITSS